MLTSIALLVDANSIIRRCLTSIFSLEFPFECHHHVWDTIIYSVLPKHIQALDYDERDLFPLQRHS